ncbi:MULTISPECIES: hypothetical protein [Larkinella]|jgi:hypothetical protein|uniref:Uncharacterized protein n=1 Tax=Larkinella punicea TaxID=2315727 RepID=A0A368JTV3_9BACT|nr:MULTISPECIES: hypothetical protein [Larkinella]RCR70376.1 hypothetical protein DUE52_05325 [Larkinella punicea]
MLTPEQKAERIARRHKEREEKMKATTGYKVWSTVFTLSYPIIALFTALFSVVVSFFSKISQGVVYVLSGGKSK